MTSGRSARWRAAAGLTLGAALILGTLGLARSGPVAPALSFQPGESLHYVIRYGIVPAGYASLAVTEGPPVRGRPTWKVVSTARTNGFWDVIFKVRDVNESWIDIQGLYSHRFVQDIREGRYRARKLTEYDYEAGVFVYAKVRKGKESRREGPLPAFVQDPLSSLYYTRTLPLEVGETYKVAANSGGKSWAMRVHVLGRETVEVPAGRFACLKVEPVMRSHGIFKNDGRLFVWLTDDAHRMPVMLRSKVTVGAFTAELIPARDAPVAPLARPPA